MYFTWINSLQNFKCSVYVYKLKKKYYDLYFILVERILSHNTENKKRNKFYNRPYWNEFCLSLLAGIGFLILSVCNSPVIVSFLQWAWQTDTSNHIYSSEQILKLCNLSLEKRTFQLLSMSWSVYLPTIPANWKIK